MRVAQNAYRMDGPHWKKVGKQETLTPLDASVFEPIGSVPGCDGSDPLRAENAVGPGFVRSFLDQVVIRGPEENVPLVFQGGGTGGPTTGQGVLSSLDFELDPVHVGQRTQK